MGFPPRAWFNYKTIGEGAFPVLFPLVRMLDPTYFTHDFWTVPGYLGANPPEYLKRARVQLKTKVTKVLTVENPETSKALGGVDTAWKQLQAEAPVAFEVESVPQGKLEGAFLYLQERRCCREKSCDWKDCWQHRRHRHQPFCPDRFRNS